MTYVFVIEKSEIKIIIIKIILITLKSQFSSEISSFSLHSPNHLEIIFKKRENNLFSY
jgi:hypothetical protein